MCRLHLFLSLGKHVELFKSIISFITCLLQRLRHRLSDVIRTVLRVFQRGHTWIVYQLRSLCKFGTYCWRSPPLYSMSRALQLMEMNFNHKLIFSVHTNSAIETQSSSSSERLPSTTLRRPYRLHKLLNSLEIPLYTSSLEPGVTERHISWLRSNNNTHTPTWKIPS